MIFLRIDLNLITIGKGSRYAICRSVAASRIVLYGNHDLRSNKSMAVEFDVAVALDGGNVSAVRFGFGGRIYWRTLALSTAEAYDA